MSVSSTNPYTRDAVNASGPPHPGVWGGVRQGGAEWGRERQREVMVRFRLRKHTAVGIKLSWQAVSAFQNPVSLLPRRPIFTVLTNLRMASESFLSSKVC